MPEFNYAELIDGVVYRMASPVHLSRGIAQRDMIIWDAPPGCDPGLESTWVMGPTKVPQPDAYMRILPEYGGQSVEIGDYGEGALSWSLR